MKKRCCHRRARGVVSPRFEILATSRCSPAQTTYMKHKALTQIIRDGVSRDERTRYDETYMLLYVFARCGLDLTDAQREVIASLPKPASVMRIRQRVLKAYREKRNKS